MDLHTLIISVIGGAGSGALTIVGLAKWLGRVWADRVLQSERSRFERELEGLKAGYSRELELYRDALSRSKSVLQAEIERSVFVSRAQFETEFEAFKRVFKALAKTRLCMAAVRPSFSLIPQDETLEERRRGLGERLEKLVDSYNVLVAVVEDQSPFYPEQIYSALQGCLKAANLEIVNVRTAGSQTFTPDWYEQGFKRMEEFMGAYRAVSDMIRKRISTLQIVPSSRVANGTPSV